MKKLVDIYPYKRTPDGIRFLLVKRSAKKIYAGQWRMIAGKVYKNESRVEAAVRELKEESGMYPYKLWVLPSINHFYDPKDDQIHLIAAFAAELESEKVILNHEHSEYEWLPVEIAVEKLHWPEQKRLLLLLSEILHNNQILPEWMVDTTYLPE